MNRPWNWLVVSALLTGLVALTFLYPSLMVSPGPLLSAHANLSANCAACRAPFRGAVAERCIACYALAEIGLKTTKGVSFPRPAGKPAFHQALATQDCLACHSEHPTPRLTRASRTTFSHALMAAGTRGNCVACHTAPSNPMHRNAAANCAQCHSSERWKPATFEHGRFFALDGDHNVACVTCHVGNDYRTYTCYGCHEHQPDPIRAKHLKEGIPNFQNCVKCHRSARHERGIGESGKQGEREGKTREGKEKDDE
jgi:hypothetical protein